MSCKNCGNNKVNIKFKNNISCNLCKITKENIKKIINNTLYIDFFDNKYYIKKILSAIEKNDQSITTQVLDMQKINENKIYFNNNIEFILPLDVDSEEKKTNINNLIITQKAKYFLNKTIYCEIPIKQSKNKITDNKYYVYLQKYILSLSANIFILYLKCITKTNITDGYLLNGYIKNYNHYYIANKNNILITVMDIKKNIVLNNYNNKLNKKK